MQGFVFRAWRILAAFERLRACPPGFPKMAPGARLVRMPDLALDHWSFLAVWLALSPWNLLALLERFCFRPPLRSFVLSFVGSFIGLR